MRKDHDFMGWTFTPTNKAKVPDLADDVYEFTVREIKPAEGGDPKYDKGYPRGEFVYELDLVGADGDNIVVRDWITIYPEPSRFTKLYSLTSALLYGGDPLPEHVDTGTDDFLGKR